MSEPARSPAGAYPRPGYPGAYTNADRIEALGKGYFGLNWAYAGALCLIVPDYFVIRAFPHIHPVWFEVANWLFFTCLLYFPIKLIMDGCGRTLGFAVVATLLVGFSAWFVWGVIGFGAVKWFARREMRKLGVPPSSLRKRAYWKLYLDNLREVESRTGSHTHAATKP